MKQGIGGNGGRRRFCFAPRKQRYLDPLTKPTETTITARDRESLMSRAGALADVVSRGNPSEIRSQNTRRRRRAPLSLG